MAARLDRDQVVRTALKLLDEVGLEGLTLRRLAKELDVQAPALYWHFANKQALLDEMATALQRELDETGAHPDPAVPWQDWFAEMFRHLRRGLLRHRDGAKVFGGTRLTGTGHAARQEELLRHLTGAGFAPGAAARAFFIAYTFTMGFVIEEQAVHPMPGERAPGYDVAERAARLSDHPLAAQVSGDLFGDFDTRFEEGLAAVVAGVEVTLLGGGAAPR
ncbi:TetR/AcrR family transcriptional regulator C-terminal domain-containing protein [Streptomyces sp. NPDC048172]|uniref:TetR/AcrR family transcriptional regulator C-terminal domain-containing protein n=1 Tax=Streptomyces sp. NPDC048172 TaxID=3365505 RepID=UPI003713A552